METGTRGTGVGWKNRPEGGGKLPLLLMAGVARRFGRRLSRLLLYPITLYYLAVRGPERRASRAYLTRVLARPARLRDIARHLHCFASTLLDRVFLLSQRFRGFDIGVHGLEALHEDMDKGRGVLLIGAHHGSFEALRVLSELRPDAVIAVVLDRSQSPVITSLLEALNPTLARHVIDAGQDPTAIVLAIREALDRGALVGLLGDRVREGHAAQSCRFLGDAAMFPLAPWLIASVLRVPVQLCFGLYRGRARYDLHFERFAQVLDVPRRERGAALAGVAQRFAVRLEHYVRLAPFNWFNFYDFWQGDGSQLAETNGGDTATRAPIGAVAAAPVEAADADARVLRGVGVGARGVDRTLDR